MTVAVSFLTWENLATFANSSFTTSLAGALAGAFAGAVAAQNIAERSKKRAEFQSQIRDINLAITLAFVILNDVISLKRQFIKQMVEVYFQQKTSREQLIAMHAARQLPDDAVYEYQADLRTIPVTRVPIEALLDHVYGKLSLTGRPLALASTLSGSLTHLANLMLKRSEMILEFKRLTDERRREEFIALYFGDAYEDGHINEEYVDVMKGLQLMNDDAIFFSHLLCQDLIEQGNIILVEFKKQFGQVIEKVNSIQLRPEKTEGIMPSSKEYADWLSGFSKPQ